VEQFLGQVLSRLAEAMAGTVSLNKEQLKTSLALVLDIILGCGAVLPYWREEMIICQESKVFLRWSTLVFRHIK
jgi:hypothetical protein